MADTKTSAESAASALDGTELVRGVQGGANVKLTVGQIAAVQKNAEVIQYAAMSALEVDVTVAGNSKSVTGDVTFTYSNATPTAGTRTRVRITADSTARTITIPTTWSLARGGNITTLLVDASTTLEILLQYLSSRWEVIGDPPASSGTGNFLKDTAGTINSAFLAAGAGIKHILPTVDGTATGPQINAFNCGYSSSAVGDLVYLDSSGTWQKCDANTLALYNGLLGIALEVKASGSALLVALPGSFVYAAAAFPTFTIGAPIYMSETPGAVTQTAPTTTDAASRVIGWAVHADKLYFMPSGTYTTHV